MKTLEEYLNLPYTIELIQEKDGSWFVAIKELPGCMSVGETPAEAFEMIRDAQRAWLETAIEDGFAIPEPRTEDYSGKFNLRVNKTLHRKLVEKADEEGVSLNTLCVSMLSEYLGVKQAIQREGNIEPARTGWDKAVREMCAFEDLDFRDADPTVVLATWLRKEIVSALQQNQPVALHQAFKVLHRLGRSDPVIAVIADLLGQMKQTMERQVQGKAITAESVNQEQGAAQVMDEYEEIVVEKVTTRKKLRTTAAIAGVADVAKPQPEDLAEALLRPALKGLQNQGKQ